MFRDTPDDNSQELHEGSSQSVKLPPDKVLSKPPVFTGPRIDHRKYQVFHKALVPVVVEGSPRVRLVLSTAGSFHLCQCFNLLPTIFDKLHRQGFVCSVL